MKSNEILSADLLDILFEGKNKDYGAYELRKTYNRRITMAVAGMLSVCLLFSFSRLIAGNSNNDVQSIPVIDINLVAVEPPLEDKIKPIEPPPVKAYTPQVRTTQFVTPIIVKDDKVEEPLPAVEELVNTKIAAVTQDGRDDDSFISPSVEVGTGATVSIKPKVEDFETKFTKIEKEAMFPGGAEGWKNYLERNLNVSVAIDDAAPVGIYKVMVQFIVDKDGNISQVKAIEVPKGCPGCGPEAVKVIKKGPKWLPAIQNGSPVTYQAIQSVTFQVLN